MACSTKPETIIAVSTPIVIRKDYSLFLSVFLELTIPNKHNRFYSFQKKSLKPFKKLPNDTKSKQLCLFPRPL